MIRLLIGVITSTALFVAADYLPDRAISPLDLAVAVSTILFACGLYIIDFRT